MSVSARVMRLSSNLRGASGTEFHLEQQNLWRRLGFQKSPAIGGSGLHLCHVLFVWPTEAMMQSLAIWTLLPKL